jgi:hypothetical protein
MEEKDEGKRTRSYDYSGKRIKIIVQDAVEARWILSIDARSGPQAHIQEALAHCLQDLHN